MLNKLFGLWHCSLKHIYIFKIRVKYLICYHEELKILLYVSITYLILFQHLEIQLKEKQGLCYLVLKFHYLNKSGAHLFHLKIWMVRDGEGGCWHSNSPFCSSTNISVLWGPANLNQLMSRWFLLSVISLVYGICRLTKCQLFTEP